MRKSTKRQNCNQEGEKSNITHKGLIEQTVDPSRFIALFGKDREQRRRNNDNSTKVYNITEREAETIINRNTF